MKLNMLVCGIVALVLTGCASTNVPKPIDDIGKTDASLRLIESGSYLAADQVIQRALSSEDRVHKSKLILVISAAVQVADPNTSPEVFKDRIIAALTKARAELGYTGETPQHWGEVAATAYAYVSQYRDKLTGDYKTEADRWTAIMSAVARGFERRAHEVIK